jgi:hypothetical protein
VDGNFLCDTEMIALLFPLFVQFCVLLQFYTSRPTTVYFIEVENLIRGMFLCLTTIELSLLTLLLVVQYSQYVKPMIGAAMLVAVSSYLVFRYIGLNLETRG